MSKLQKLGVGLAFMGLAVAGCGAGQENHPISCAAEAPAATELGDLVQSRQQFARAVLQCYNSLPRENRPQDPDPRIINLTIDLADGGQILFMEGSDVPFGNTDYAAKVNQVGVFINEPSQRLGGPAEQSIQFDDSSAGWYGELGEEVTLDTDKDGQEYISAYFPNESRGPIPSSRDSRVIACILGTDQREFIAAMRLNSSQDTPYYATPAATPDCNAV